MCNDSARTKPNGDEGDFVGEAGLCALTLSRGQSFCLLSGLGNGVYSGLASLLLSGLKGAVDGNVNELVETGVRFHARGGLFAAFDDTEIVREEADAPFDGFEGAVMLQRMGLALGFFDEFSVRDTGLGPVLREMIGIEFVETKMVARRADNDTFAAFLADFLRVHGSADGFEERIEPKIAHAFGMRSDLGRKRDKNAAIGSQTVDYAIFQVLRHALYVTD